VSLPTAPCTSCGQRVVYGQRRCPACGTTFDYGPTPPPEPTPAQVHEAHAFAQSQLAPSLTAAAPAAARAREAMPLDATADFLDTGRFDDVPDSQVVPEAIPGFIDSTLFKAFTPAHVDVEAVDGLEQTAYDGGGAGVFLSEAPPVEHTSLGAVGEVATEAIPGFIESTLFKAFTPAVIQTEAVEGLEISTSAAASGQRPARAPAGGGKGAGLPCRDCGMAHDETSCPACGARRRGG
jgi:hypothetical protein